MKKIFITIIAMLLPLLANATYINGINYNLNSSTQTATVAKGSYSGWVNIPSQVTYGGVTYTVTYIGSNAFENCTSLTSVTIPYGVTSIGYRAFRGCTSLNSVNIPNTVTSISIDAFMGCSSLASINIPSSVTSIDENAFDGFRGIVNIQDLKAWCKISFHLDVFNSYRPLYVNGEKIEHLVIPSGVTSISNYAFSFFSGLTSVTIPNSVTSIGYMAFWGCSGLTFIASERTDPIEIGNNVFSNYATVKLVVPSGTKSAYESKAGWDKFTNIVEYETKRTIHVETAGTLPDLIPEEDNYLISELTLTGELNGTDLGFLREMAGKKRDVWTMMGSDLSDYGIKEYVLDDRLNDPYYDTRGYLKVLDISNVNIVSGGSAHFTVFDSDNREYSFYSSDNTMPDYVFCKCSLISINNSSLKNQDMA